MQKLLSLCRHPKPASLKILTTNVRYRHTAEHPKNFISTAKKYVLTRFAQFVKGYEKFLEKNFPSAANVYRVFVFGTRDFYKDMKKYMQVSRAVRTPSRGFKSLTRSEIEIYFRMPREMKKVAPVLILSTLPFANYVVFPLAYMFPKRLLSSHFWTLQQRLEFSVDDLRKRLYNNRPVFRCLQVRLDSIESDKSYRDWAYVLSLLGSGVHPDIKLILKCARLFEGEPYHFSCLYNNHVNGLLRMHGMHVGFFRRRRLKDRALVIHEMDLAMQREDINSMSLDELRW
ncbi:hypothetical protein J437_LFUL003792, partial [Ladona fulva]